MSRILYIHWSPAEAVERAARLRRGGHEVETRSEPGSAGFRAVRANPPELFVIDLSRLPSHGRDVAVWLRRQKATHRIPILFVGGDPERVASVGSVLPDAAFTEWRRIRAAVRQAIRNRPSDPVVPDTMAGYAGTPLPKKLGIRTGSVVALLGSPARFERKLRPLPRDVHLRKQARGRADLILLFVRSRRDLERRFPTAARALAARGGLWIVWRKRTPGVVSELTQSDVRAFGLERGFVDHKICAVDAQWSGLRFARRRSGRS